MVPRVSVDTRASGRVMVALGAIVLVVAGCADDGASTNGASSDERAPAIVATTAIWGDVVSNLACDGLAEVEVLIPAGADPHGFEPSLADRGDLEAADLVVINGLRLEEGLQDTIDAVEDGGTPVFAVADHLETIEYSIAPADELAEEHSEDEQAENESFGTGDADGADPHVWFDPIRVSSALPALAQRLIEDVGLDPSAVRQCLAGYQGELEAIDAEITAILDPIPGPRRKLITNHNSLGYFADRYGFEVIGTVIPASSGLAEATPAQLGALAELIEANDVPAVFAESQHATDDADALAGQVGDVEVVLLVTGTLGQPGSDAGTYLGLLRSTAELVAQGLGSRQQP